MIPMKMKSLEWGREGRVVSKGEQCRIIGSLWSVF